MSSLVGGLVLLGLNVLDDGRFFKEERFCWMAWTNEEVTFRRPSQKTKRPCLLVFVDGALSWAC